MITIIDLRIYPIKSCGGISVQTMEMGETGPIGDREYVLVKKKTKLFVSQKTPRCAKLCLVKVLKTDRNETVFTIPEQAPHIINTAESFGQINFVMYDKNQPIVGEMIDMEAAQLFSEYLGFEVLLLRLPVLDNTRTAPNSDQSISFADSHPLLLVNDASVRDMNDKIGTTGISYGVERFRYNVLIKTNPYHEDKWEDFHVGPDIYERGEACGRCKIICIDPTTGIADPGNQPLKILRTYRKHTDLDLEEKGIYMGVRFFAPSSAFLFKGSTIDYVTLASAPS